MANALVSIQILPRTANGESVLPFVDRAIDIIKASGVAYRVSPLETTMEGDLNELLQIIQMMNEEMDKLGSTSTISQVKILYNPKQGASMERQLEKYPNGQ